LNPSSSPSTDPSHAPNSLPLSFPSSIPSNTPSVIPSILPSNPPSYLSTLVPSMNPSSKPSLDRSNFPTMVPSFFPSLMPSEMPSQFPSLVLSAVPSVSPSLAYSQVPSSVPSIVPSNGFTNFESTLSLPLSLNVDPPFLSDTDIKVLESVVEAFLLKTLVRSRSVLVNIEAVSLVDQKPHIFSETRSRILQDGNTFHSSVTAKLSIFCGAKALQSGIADPKHHLIPNLLHGFSSNFDDFLVTLNNSSGTFVKHPNFTPNRANSASHDRSGSDLVPLEGDSASSIVAPVIALSVAGTAIFVAIGAFCYVFRRHRTSERAALAGREILTPIDQDKYIIDWARRSNSSNSQDARDTSILPLFSLDEQNMVFDNIQSIQPLSSSTSQDENCSTGKGK